MEKHDNKIKTRSILVAKKIFLIEMSGGRNPQIYTDTSKNRGRELPKIIPIIRK